MNTDWIIKWIKIGIVTAFLVMIVATAFADPGHTHVMAPGTSSPCSSTSFWDSFAAGVGRFFMWPLLF